MKFKRIFHWFTSRNIGFGIDCAMGYNLFLFCDGIEAVDFFGERSRIDVDRVDFGGAFRML